jgi:hypothetical protein
MGAGSQERAERRASDKILPANCRRAFVFFQKLRAAAPMKTDKTATAICGAAVAKK